MENVTVIQSHRAYSWRQCFMTIILKIIITYKKIVSTWTLTAGFYVVFRVDSIRLNEKR